MGLFSLLFGSDPKKEIEEAHYHESARKNIETKKYQIKKEKEKIESLRKKLK